MGAARATQAERVLPTAEALGLEVMLVLVGWVLCCGLCVIRVEEVRQARQAS